jgi:hypothetical protein
MSSLPQSHPSPLRAEQWQAEFIQAIHNDLQTHDDPLIPRLLADQDTLNNVADHVRRYVTDFWTETNQDRSLLGAEIRQKLPSAIAGQKSAIKIFEILTTRYRDLDMSALNTDPRQSLEMSRALLGQLELIQNRVSDAFNVKPMGYKGDLQTLYSLYCFLRHRLGSFSYDTLASLLDCGRTVEGQDKEVEDGMNLKKRLDGFRNNHPPMAEQTEIAARSLPRK